MRRFFLILPLFIVISAQAYSQAEIRVDCPSSWGPGRYSKVTVTVIFGTKNGFARLTQEYPVGFSVIEGEAADGDFSWNGNQVNVVWMKIPATGKATFTYLISPGREMYGDFDMNARLATVTGGVKKTDTQMPDRKIMIGGTAGLLPGELEKEQSKKIVTNVTNINPENMAQASSSTVYRVQVSSSSEKLSAAALRKKLGISGDEKVTIVSNGNVYKYQLGEFSDRASAAAYQKKLVSMGIKDAFVVASK